jgi:VIT1/CCC1 family predicted Fe2+/Mn2+ transporter
MRSHLETHRSQRIGWLRASVLGANDGIVSTASLVVGVSAANADRNSVLIAGVAGLVAGAMSMAAGEFVSVSSQSDTENADIAIERRELAETPELELDELQRIYVDRGLDAPLARQVAENLMAKDALQAHIRDELGITEIHAARPLQAAGASAASFAVGAAIPLMAAALAPANSIIAVVSASTLVCLVLLGGVAAQTGGASVVRGALRVVFWGILALVATALVGKLFGTVV